MYYKEARNTVTRKRREEMTTTLAKANRDKDDVAGMLIELLYYTKVGVKKENGAGIRALNQILDILIDMGYEGLLKKEGKGRIGYMAHPTYGVWKDGKFKKEVFFCKENTVTYENV